MIKDFLRRIDNQLGKHRFNRPWLSRETDIPLSTINSWFSKNRLPRVDHAYKIGNMLGVSVEYLMTGTESSESDNPDIKEILKELETLSHKELQQVLGVIKLFIHIRVPVTLRGDI